MVLKRNSKSSRGEVGKMWGYIVFNHWSQKKKKKRVHTPNLADMTRSTCSETIIRECNNKNSIIKKQEEGGGMYLSLQVVIEMMLFPILIL